MKQCKANEKNTFKGFCLREAIVGFSTSVPIKGFKLLVVQSAS